MPFVIFTETIAMKYSLILLFVIGSFGFAQTQVNRNEQLADNYFDRGEFEKALITYQKLNEEHPNNYQYLYKLVKTHQQLEQYDVAKELLETRLEKRESPSLLVELGYNYQIQQQQSTADELYQKAISKIDDNPIYASSLARQFENHSLLEEAITVYKKGMELNPDINFNYQLARLYGEMGNIELLFESYINYIAVKPDFLNNAKRLISDFISENKDNENNSTLRRLLIKRIQQQPDVYWYELLSWLFIQEKEFDKAFTQEKALYKRNPESLGRIIDLAVTSVKDEDYETATDIFNYVLETSQDVSTVLMAHQYILDMRIKNADDDELDKINQEYQSLFETYGSYEQTLALQIAYADFLSFYLHQPKEASAFLKKSLDLPLSPFQIATVKLKLGDILVFQEKFNEALIYYSQIQANLKNSTVSQEARFKVAKTSYYKGDFKWAESQLKILKASTSQLIANDALDLKLLISDNIQEDTLHVALKLYAKADLLAFQNKKEEAISVLNDILEKHKGESIEDQALVKQARLFEEKRQFEKAAENYQYVIDNYRDGILADDAYFFLAELYRNELAQPEKAKALYEIILFEHEDSIYFIEARKQFRMLRGDAIN